MIQGWPQWWQVLQHCNNMTMRVQNPVLILFLKVDISLNFRYRFTSPQVQLSWQQGKISNDSYYVQYTTREVNHSWMVWKHYKNYFISVNWGNTALVKFLFTLKKTIWMTCVSFTQLLENTIAKWSLLCALFRKLTTDAIRGRQLT